jgi:peptidoglycan hydrolase-like protein with peptidoglycan-binding domain
VHTDDLTGVAFNIASSTVKLVQALLNDAFGERPKLLVDGDYGPKTRAAVARALSRLELSGDIRRDVNLWRQFLRRSATLALRESAV